VTPPRSLPVSWLLPLLLGVSGFCGLAYEVVWLRQVGLLVGMDGVATGVVAATFMGGMGVGYAAAGRWADGLRNPVRVFGLLEAGIGALALLMLVQFALGGLLLNWLFEVLPTWVPALVIQLPTAMILLLPPTVLMGATLPVACVPHRRGGRSLGTSVGLLYGANLAGATAGALAGGWWLLDLLGVHGTVMVLAVLNGTVAAIAILAGRGAEPAAAPAPDDEPPEPAPVPAAAGPLGRLPLMVAALSGTVSLAFEIVWIRGLTPFIGSTVYAFSAALAAFLAGLALGSAAVSWLLRRPASPAAIRTLIGGLLALSGLAYAAAPWLLQIWLDLSPGVARLASQAHLDIQYPHLTLGEGLALALITMLPATLAGGATMPLVAQVARGGGGGDRVGRCYALNSAGSATGALLAHFLLLHLLAIRASLLLVGALAVTGGIAVLLTSDRPTTRLRWGLAGATAAACLLLVVLMPPRPVDLFAGRILEGEIRFYEEGPLAAVLVVGGSRGDEESGAPHLVLDGHQIASGTGEPKFATLTLNCVDGDPTRAAIIGLGTGGTCEGAADYGDQVQVDCVEILGGVVRAQPVFQTFRGRDGAPANVTYVRADGRNHLLRTRETYDAIFVDGGQVEFRGGYELFTVEFYRLVASRLSPGGALGVWVQAEWYAQYGDDLQRTLLEEFDWVVSDDAEMMVVAGFGEPEGRACRGDRTVTRETAAAMIGDGPVLTDARPELMYLQMRARAFEAREIARGGSPKMRDPVQGRNRWRDVLMEGDAPAGGEVFRLETHTQDPVMGMIHELSIGARDQSERSAEAMATLEAELAARSDDAPALYAFLGVTGEVTQAMSAKPLPTAPVVIRVDGDGALWVTGAD